MIIVGLTGSIGSGKTTFADFLAAQFAHAGHWESWQLVAEVAEALRRQPSPGPDDIVAINEWLRPLPAIVDHVCHKIIGFDDLRLAEDVDQHAPEYVKLFQYLELMKASPELQQGPISENRKESLRSILQWLGGYLAKTCGGDIWYAEIIRRIQTQPKLELATIGGVRFLADAACIRQADGLVVGVIRPGWEARDKNDPTERERNRIALDSTIYNDGSLRQLEQCAALLAADMVSGKPANEYIAAKA
jgi:hypothetical protein